MVAAIEISTHRFWKSFLEPLRSLLLNFPWDFRVTSGVGHALAMFVLGTDGRHVLDIEICYEVVSIGS